MSLGGPSEAQIILLPARTPAESSAWGSAAMEYAAAFQTIDFSRDPQRVDWRGYQHVTIVRPNFWPADLALVIKQANPDIVIDRLPVDTPEALQLVLHVRVYYGWRYGPKTAADLDRLMSYDQTLRYVEIHNEPNVTLEGLGTNWKDGYEFGDWFLTVLGLFRRRFPNALFGFPGLSPGPTSDAQGRLSSEIF